jgi:alkylation response protein AidB-like acyl-CoA dehydrogenase
MVDMYIEIEMAQSATYLGVLKLGAEPTERASAVSAAKMTVSNACRFVGQNAIQLHGGMGMTDDLAVSHYFRRATVMERELGGVDFHLARYAALSGRRSGG